jgi:pyruvate/2-oxoglutarate dehydrogenase complex dihydrolipoamide dehydrogenase (E3) component
MKKFDAIIIGSGQAGTPLAFKMASEGKKVAFIEKEQLGGTCLNVGCTPTKTYVASARRMWDAQNGNDLGIIIPEGAYADLKKLNHYALEVHRFVLRLKVVSYSIMKLLPFVSSGRL